MVPVIICMTFGVKSLLFRDACEMIPFVQFGSQGEINLRGSVEFNEPRPYNRMHSPARELT